LDPGQQSFAIECRSSNNRGRCDRNGAVVTHSGGWRWRTPVCGEINCGSLDLRGDGESEGRFIKSTIVVEGKRRVLCRRGQLAGCKNETQGEKKNRVAPVFQESFHDRAARSRSCAPFGRQRMITGLFRNLLTRVAANP